MQRAGYACASGVSSVWYGYIDLRQVRAETSKVVWPTQQQLVTYLIVVIVFVLAMIAYVSLLDVAFGKAVFALFGGK